MISTLPSFETVRLETGKTTEYWINSSENNDEGVDVIARICEFLDETGAKVVSLRLIGSQVDVNGAMCAYKNELDKMLCPPLLIREESSAFGVQIYAVSGTDVCPVYFDGELVGSSYNCDQSQYYMLRILPSDPQANEYDQTISIFEKIAAVLKHEGSSFHDTIRTWLYGRDILSWYGELNNARNHFFTENDVFGKLVPASTGIGIDNHHGVVMATQVLAIKSPRPNVKIQKANSPLQCPALDYKSSFSRGMIVDSNENRRLYVSGTASIDQSGKTVYLDDTPCQIEMTMKVVTAILKDAGMDWDNTVSSLVYFKDASQFFLFDEFCEQNDLKIPHIKVHSDVCRDDLLFEIELDAVKKI